MEVYQLPMCQGTYQRDCPLDMEVVLSIWRGEYFEGLSAFKILKGAASRLIARLIHTSKSPNLTVSFQLKWRHLC